MTYAGYRRIQNISLRMALTGLRKRKKDRRCSYCRSRIGTMVWEHRNYCSPLEVVTACGSCNKKLGPGAIDYYNVETLEMVRVKFKRVIGGGRFHRRYRETHPDVQPRYKERAA